MKKLDGHVFISSKSFRFANLPWKAEMQFVQTREFMQSSKLCVEMKKATVNVMIY